MSQAAVSGPDGARPAPDVSLPDATLLPPGFLGGLLGVTPQTIVYIQSSTLTSTLRAPSDDAAAILAATQAAVVATRQRAQDVTRALEKEQAVVDAIERQYAETYCRLAGKSVLDGSPTFARHSATYSSPR
jgi:hypothetical protein